MKPGRKYLFRRGWRLKLIRYPERAAVTSGTTVLLDDGWWVRVARLWRCA